MTAATSELLMFQIGARLFATQVDDVVRIGSSREAAPGALVTDTALGEPLLAARAIVVGCGGEEQALAVDQVLGIRTVSHEDLRDVPAFAACCLQSSAVAGVVILDDSPTVLVDLSTLIRERRRPPGDEAHPRPHHA